MRQIVLYQAQNLMTGERYIGASKNGLRKRAQGHYSAANQGKGGRIGAAIRSYGRENIIFSILAVCPTYRYALDMETAYIMTSNPEYNIITDRGFWSGKKRSQESIIKTSLTKKSAPKRPPTERETLARRLCIKLATAARLKPVVCINTGEIFDSMAEAAIKFGVPRTNIWFACRNPGRRVRGMEFCYASDH